ncbi:hypothetical protein GCM10023324_08100 [Streptomyces youssoufiensis]
MFGGQLRVARAQVAGEGQPCQPVGEGGPYAQGRALAHAPRQVGELRGLRAGQLLYAQSFFGTPGAEQVAGDGRQSVVRGAVGGGLA